MGRGDRLGAYLIAATWITLGLAKLLAPDEIASALLAHRLGVSGVWVAQAYTMLAVLEVLCGAAVLVRRATPWNFSSSFWLAATLCLARLILPFDSQRCGCLGRLADPGRGVALAIVVGLASASAYLLRRTARMQMS